MEILYRDFPVEQARLRFEEVKAQAPPARTEPVVKVRRKLRIAAPKPA